MNLVIYTLGRRAGYAPKSRSCSGHFPTIFLHLQKRSSREVNGGRKNAGSGIGKARHGLQFARDHCLSIVRWISNHVNPCQNHIRFQNSSVVWTDVTCGHLRNRKQHLEGKTHADIFKFLCCLDRCDMRTFAKTLCAVCVVQTHIRFRNYSGNWTNVTRGHLRKKPASVDRCDTHIIHGAARHVMVALSRQPHQPGPAAPAAQQANSAAVQQSIRERA